VTPTSPEPAAAGVAAKPLVVAHRGSSAALPEHTIGAYLRAIDEGADGLECDVRLTRDGHLVCIHDGRLNRVSDGTGRVSTHVLAQLDELDFGSWHPHPDGGAPVGIRTRVLTLDTLLDAAVGAGRPLRVFIETKHPTRYGAEVEDRLVAMLRRYGLDRPSDGTGVDVTVMSFSQLAVRRMHVRAPRLDKVLLTEFARPDLRDGRLPAGANIAGPGVRVVRANPLLVAAWHRRGYRVYVWTVNEPADVDLMIDLGVDAIITDRPRMVLDRLS
jgi:glycerophosphoryl diester phosphodiesterase